MKCVLRYAERLALANYVDLERVMNTEQPTYVNSFELVYSLL